MSRPRAARPWRLSLRPKIALAMALVAALVVGATLTTTYYQRRADLLNEFQVFVRGVAGTTALALDADEVVAIQHEADSAFGRARIVLDQARAINGLDAQEIYILRPAPGGSAFEMEFAVMLQRKTFIGSKYTIPEQTRPQLLTAWSDAVPAATGIYTDAHGRWISAYAALISKKTGKPLAILEADAEVSRFIEKQRSALLVSMATGVGAFCIAMLPGLLLARSITRGLQKLSLGMQRFRSGDHAVQVSIGTADEIEDLGSVFNEMIL